MKTTKRYSAAFQRQVLDEIARGQYGSIHQASQAYGLGTPTVYRWIRAQGREGLLPPKKRIETMKEPRELTETRQRIRELEAALAKLGAGSSSMALPAGSGAAAGAATGAAAGAPLTLSLV